MPNQTFTIKIYLDDGRIFKYNVDGESSAREHASAIVGAGYRHNDKDVFEVYPPHRINKIKVIGRIRTNYSDEMEGT